MATITLPSVITTVVQPQVVATASTLTITRMVDLPSEQKVNIWVSTQGFNKQAYTIWEGAAYTAIGQWTDSQAQSRLVELFTSSTFSASVL